DVSLTIEEVDKGVERTFPIERAEACASCTGTGAKPGTHAKTCSACGGAGVIVRGQGFLRIQQTCPRCSGEGHSLEKNCPACGGQGAFRRKREIKIKIPAGVDEGTQFRLDGQGEAGANGAPPGDLYVAVHVQEHALFHRKGADLYGELPVPFVELALGTKLDVPTLHGSASVTIPKGTPSGKVFRLRGQGIAGPGGRGRGDLHVRVIGEVPKKLSARQEALLRELAEIEKTQPSKRGFFERFKEMFE
ncbi:MAG TPA: DnaJ C-terminal domain-containing protein, partial [Planctomycetota bacterium]|nr:DnaJ C-terminal domain-containing protein [Planctomycetota bacterium]